MAHSVPLCTGRPRALRPRCQPSPKLPSTQQPTLPPARTSSPYSARTSSPRTSSYPPQLYSHILSSLPSALPSTPSSPRTLLDLGCGPGLSTFAFVPSFSRVIGLDPSEGMARAARALVVERGVQGDVRFEVGKGEDLSALVAGSVDLAVAGGSLSLVLCNGGADDSVGQAAHWFDCQAVYRELLRVLKPGGGFAFWVRPPRSLLRGLTNEFQIGLRRVLLPPLPKTISLDPTLLRRYSRYAPLPSFLPSSRQPTLRRSLLATTRQVLRRRPSYSSPLPLSLLLRIRRLGLNDLRPNLLRPSLLPFCSSNPNFAQRNQDFPPPPPPNAPLDPLRTRSLPPHLERRTDVRRETRRGRRSCVRGAARGGDGARGDFEGGEGGGGVEDGVDGGEEGLRDANGLLFSRVLSLPARLFLFRCPLVGRFLSFLLSRHLKISREAGTRNNYDQASPDANGLGGWMRGDGGMANECR